MLRFSSFGRIVAAAATISCITFASQSNARGVIIDTGNNWPHGSLCNVAAGCSPITLGFSISTGGALTNQVYAYNDGVVSFGAPLSASSIAKLTNPSATKYDITSLGTDNVAASVLGSILDTSNYAGSDVQAVDFSENDANGLVFEFYVNDPNAYNGYNISELTIAPGSNPGSFSLIFREGDQIKGFPQLDPKSTIGYSIGGQTGSNLFKANLGKVGLGPEQEYDGPTFDLLPASSATPEPSLWALMLVSVGGIGAMLRRRRPLVQAA